MLTAEKYLGQNQRDARNFTREIRRARAGAITLLAALALAGCKEEADKPAAHTLTDAAIGHYCGMMLTEHEGPKGQILLEGDDEPVWFSSVRDTVAFTLLPEESKDIAAIYVSDMGTAPSWAEPGADNWTDAKAASFVIGSDVEGGMGGTEAVPFAEAEAAQAFAAEHGGTVVAFDAIPADYILPYAPDETAAEPEDQGHHDH
ncbi:MAG TPA: nitrous oxide reductase accessory protein NosL [Amaricoccus sp.]|nr:nitrous oxide reductase accessory protein NosL [Amaricoccus sp.]